MLGVKHISYISTQIDARVDYVVNVFFVIITLSLLLLINARVGFRAGF